jgi:hypothetical protein
MSCSVLSEDTEVPETEQSKSGLIDVEGYVALLAAIQ